MKKIAIIVVLVIGVAIFVISQRSDDISNDDASAKQENLAVVEGVGDIKENGGYKTVLTEDVPGAKSIFNFSFAVLEDWEVEAVLEPESLNIFDTTGEEENSLENSQIFITAFVANDFQTLDTVNILSRTEHEVVGRPAATYVISKKEETPDFEGEPSWRNETHKITVIRISDENPSLFYVFAKNPNLAEAEFKRFLNSIEF